MMIVGKARKHFQGRTAEPQISPLRSPGFPVKTRGFDDLHAALFTESRTRGRRWQRSGEICGFSGPSCSSSID
jgi:hypothetical protein